MEKLDSEILDLIAKLEREPMELTREQVKLTLEKNGLEPTEALVNFQMNFGGLVLKAGEEKIQFGIIWGGGFPFNPDVAIVEFEQSEYENRKFDILCARTNYQMDFSIDENGNYYEDNELKHKSFVDALKEITNKKSG